MRRWCVLVGLGLLLAAPRPARASVEEFSTFDAFSQEDDDENTLDHFLSRPPREWRAEWDTAASGLRADQGCLTSADWYQSNEFRGRSPLGRHSWLDLEFLQRTDLEASWQWLQFDFHRAAGRYGTAGLRVRPAYDKSTQDFALLWDVGDATRPLHVRGTFTLEDTFNKFWEFKQERVGNRAEPYRTHPYEPALEGTWRGPRHRVEFAGTWLTPSRKRIVDPDPALDGSFSLWGSKVHLLAERVFAPGTVQLVFDGIQARSARSTAAAPGDGRVYRRRWSAEAALRRDFGRLCTAETRYAYMTRDESWRPPVASGRFHALDRMAAAELDWHVHANWIVRSGLLYDRIGIALDGAPPGFTYGSRKESRAFFGLQARFERVRVQVVEGVELDSEPYDVAFHHDKAFLHLQTTF